MTRHHITSDEITRLGVAFKIDLAEVQLWRIIILVVARLTTKTLAGMNLTTRDCKTNGDDM